MTCFFEIFALLQYLELNLHYHLSCNAYINITAYINIKYNITAYININLLEGRLHFIISIDLCTIL